MPTLPTSQDLVQKLTATALLGIMEQSARNILMHAEDLDSECFFSSRLIRKGLERQFRQLVDAAAIFPPALQDLEREIAWEQLGRLSQELRHGTPGKEHWLQLMDILPAALLGLKELRQRHPEAFPWNAPP